MSGSAQEQQAGLGILTSLAQIGGALAGYATQPGPFNPSYQMFDQAGGLSPTRAPYGNEASAAEGRVGSVNNPNVGYAAGDAQQLRQLQNQYLQQLLEQARGVTSYSQRAMQSRMQQTGADLGSMANSARGNFDAIGARGRSMQMQAGLPMDYEAPMRAAMLDERNQALGLYMDALGQRSTLDRGALDLERQRRQQQQRQDMAGANARMGYYDLASANKQAQMRDAIHVQSIIKAARND